MERYWFYGSLPKDTITEKELTNEHHRIIESENKKINNENFDRFWIGYRNDKGWDFMRHGFKVIHVKEEKPNIARDKLLDIVKEKYYQEQ